MFGLTTMDSYMRRENDLKKELVKKFEQKRVNR